MSARFEVGMNVVCVKQDPWKQVYPDETAPVYRRVYTVREVTALDDGIFLRFVELVNPKRLHASGRHGEAAWHAKWFEPCQRTDISELVKLAVNPPREPVNTTIREFDHAPL